MTLKTPLRVLLAALLGSAAFGAQGATVWDESLQEDLADVGSSPTLIGITTGSNTILGDTGNSGQGIDRDYFSIDVPEGTRLASIILLSATNVSGSVSFMALQAGPQITASTEGAGSDALLGFGHYGNDLVGTDLLARYLGPGGLGSGRYSFWVQETGGPATYGFDFNVTPVPLPGAAMLLLSGLAGMAALRRRREPCQPT